MMVGVLTPSLSCTLVHSHTIVHHSSQTSDRRKDITHFHILLFILNNQIVPLLAFCQIAIFLSPSISLSEQEDSGPLLVLLGLHTRALLCLTPISSALAFTSTFVYCNMLSLEIPPPPPQADRNLSEKNYFSTSL